MGHKETEDRKGGSGRMWCEGGDCLGKAVATKNVMEGTGLHHLFTSTTRSAPVYTSSHASLLLILCHRSGKSDTGSSGQLQVSRALYVRPGALPFHVAL